MSRANQMDRDALLEMAHSQRQIADQHRALAERTRAIAERWDGCAEALEQLAAETPFGKRVDRKVVRALIEREHRK
jgi:hypothetical protein